jgi:dienelactone hydrolase
VIRTRVLVAFVVVALGAAACASGSARTGGPDSTSSTTTRLLAAPTGAFDHVQLPLEDTSRPAVDPIAVRSAPTRQLPTELYLPTGSGPRPLIVFAHGYNGDPGKFTQLFEHWAKAGFAVAAPRFPITYTGATDGPLSRSADIAQQPADVSFVLDQILAGQYASRIDRTRIGVAGLSLGGGTTWGLISDRCCIEKRFRAAVVMDGNRFGFGAATYVPNKIPLMVFHIRTDIALPYAAARTAYLQASPPKYFVTIFQGVHPEPFEDEPSTADDMVRQSTVSFWRAYLLDDAKARSEIVATATVADVSKAEGDPGT